MEKQTRHLAGGTATIDFLASRNTMVKPVIVKETKDYYETADGKQYVKDTFNRLFKPPKGKVKPRHKGDNPDKTKDWMK